tara:strand:+ start:659 stop:970 length:312 start_codon:yes stop_codon:yes gene_type:complete
MGNLRMTRTLLGLVGLEVVKTASYMHLKIKSIINKKGVANNMTRINRRVQGATRNTISVTLPHECIIILNRAMNRYGNNRSLALEYIIKDWERARQAEREARQ